MARLRLVLFCLSSGLLGASCGGEDDSRDRNRPPTFFDNCSGSADCAEPFACLAHPQLTKNVCTLECQVDAECPRWRATGHCAGDYQSPCNFGICEYSCK
jgi:hypothetical protein